MNQEDFTFSPNLSRSTKFLKNLSEMIFSGCYSEKLIYVQMFALNWEKK